MKIKINDTYSLVSESVGFNVVKKQLGIKGKVAGKEIENTLAYNIPLERQLYTSWDKNKERGER